MPRDVETAGAIPIERWRLRIGKGSIGNALSYPFSTRKNALSNLTHLRRIKQPHRRIFLKITSLIKEGSLNELKIILRKHCHKQCQHLFVTAQSTA